MQDELTLEEWLVSTAEKRAALLKYAQSPISTDPGERHLDVSKAIENGQDAGDLLADVEKHLIDETGKAILSVRAESAKLEKECRPSSDERKGLVKAKVSGIARLRDGLQVIYTSIKDRRFVLMNLNRI